MSKLSTRISTILKEMEGPERGRQSRLAKLAGCSRGLVNQWLAGLNESMGYDYAKNIERELGYSIDWLIQGTGPVKTTKTPALTLVTTDIEISQYHDAAGAMGTGVVLRDQPGEIQSWRVTPEWIQKNIKTHTGVSNLAIVTGFGDSMKPLYNPGDPLIVDTGVKSVEFDAVYFFRVGNEGFIKRLQRIPGEGIRVLSTNKEYEAWTIRPDMDFEVFGRVLKVWCSTDF